MTQTPAEPAGWCLPLLDDRRRNIETRNWAPELQNAIATAACSLAIAAGRRKAQLRFGAIVAVAATGRTTHACTHGRTDARTHAWMHACTHPNYFLTLTLTPMPSDAVGHVHVTCWPSELTAPPHTRAHSLVRAHAPKCAIALACMGHSAVDQPHRSCEAQLRVLEGLWGEQQPADDKHFRRFLRTVRRQFMTIDLR